MLGESERVVLNLTPGYYFRLENLDEEQFEKVYNLLLHKLKELFIRNEWVTNVAKGRDEIENCLRI
jgi:hypothetical protein